MGKFSVRCLECNSNVRGAFNFKCPEHDALVRSYYSTKKIRFKDLPGVWRFNDWLPVKGISDYEGKSITYKSEGLAKELGLGELYIAFNGYWPERDAMLKTSTFKELEAIVTIEYTKEHGKNRLVVASAGNTAKAFAYMATLRSYPVILVVPKKCITDFWTPDLNHSFVKTVVLRDGDYSDAIDIAKKISSFEGFTFEGGARNFARRDGLATVLLNAVEKIRKLPRHYFQSIGSGTGGISTWEAAIRLREDGRFGKQLPKLHLSQNLPFAPMFNAWKEGRREIVFEKDIPNNGNLLDLIYAKVLTNKYPCYGAKGGTFDALLDTGGEMYGITNDEATKASKLFESSEEIDIVPAASVAVASLIRAVDGGKVSSNECILLNITGGGIARVLENISIQEIKEDITVRKDTPLDELREAVI